MTSTTNGDRVTGTPDEHYDLISVLYHALEGAMTYEIYMQDADDIGDEELARFFQEVKEQSTQLAERAKTLLAKRLAQQPAMR
jgi:rubrerythrin